MEDNCVDLFDTVIHLEKCAYERGFGEALVSSETGGSEGYRAGFTKGYFTALEAAFYEYAASEGEAAAGGSKGQLLARVVSSISFESINEVNLDDKLEEARALYKKSRASRMLGPFDDGSVEAGNKKCGSDDCGCKEKEAVVEIEDGMRAQAKPTADW